MNKLFLFKWVGKANYLFPTRLSVAMIILSSALMWTGCKKDPILKETNQPKEEVIIPSFDLSQAQNWYAKQPKKLFGESSTKRGTELVTEVDWTQAEIDTLSTGNIFINAPIVNIETQNQTSRIAELFVECSATGVLGAYRFNLPTTPTDEPTNPTYSGDVLFFDLQGQYYYGERFENGVSMGVVDITVSNGEGNRGAGGGNAVQDITCPEGYQDEMTICQPIARYATGQRGSGAAATLSEYCVTYCFSSGGGGGVSGGSSGSSGSGFGGGGTGSSTGSTSGGSTSSGYIPPGYLTITQFKTMYGLTIPDAVASSILGGGTNLLTAITKLKNYIATKLPSGQAIWTAENSAFVANNPKVLCQIANFVYAPYIPPYDDNSGAEPVLPPTPIEKEETAKLWIQVLNQDAAMKQRNDVAGCPAIGNTAWATVLMTKKIAIFNGFFLDPPSAILVAFCVGHPLAALSISSNSIVAQAKTDYLYPPTYLYPTNLNNAGDAFRHAYWNALNRIRVGAALTQEFYTVYEVGTPVYLQKEKEMDMYNNAKGSEIGADFTLQQMYYQPQLIITAIQNAISNHQLVKLAPITPFINNNTAYMNDWWDLNNGQPGHHGISGSTQLVTTP